MVAPPMNKKIKQLLRLKNYCVKLFPSVLDRSFEKSIQISNLIWVKLSLFILLT